MFLEKKIEEKPSMSVLLINKLNECHEYIFRANEKLKVDASQPTTSIQIRLADGSRLSGRFNLTHTINDLREYIVK